MGDADIDPNLGWETPPLPEAHPCELPVMTFADEGRPWKCPVCDARWSLQRRNKSPITRLFESQGWTR